MGDLLFSPNGRIGSAAFMKAGYILILIGTALGMVKMFNPVLGAMFGFLSMLLLYPWVCIWIKRLHNGGKSGWMIFLYILIYGVIIMTSTLVVLSMFAGSEFFALVSEKMADEISQTEYMERIETMGQNLALPTTIAGILSSLLTLYIGDNTIPNDDGENQFG